MKYTFTHVLTDHKCKCEISTVPSKAKSQEPTYSQALNQNKLIDNRQGVNIQRVNQAIIDGQTVRWLRSMVFKVEQTRKWRRLWFWYFAYWILLKFIGIYVNSLLITYDFSVTSIIARFLLQCFLFAASQDYQMLYQVQYIACLLLIPSGLNQLRKRWPFDWRS